MGNCPCGTMGRNMGVSSAVLLHRSDHSMIKKKRNSYLDVQSYLRRHYL